MPPSNFEQMGLHYVNMVSLTFFLSQAWQWVADTGVNLVIILVLALLVPRAGRFAERRIEHNVKESVDEDQGKTHLAFAGVAIYVAQIVAYFLLSIWFLQEIGFSLAGAAIPATVVSAAIGFGAQSIIADFLAGFFVLTEKQYGVGDWVRFVGNGVEVEGTVIQVTMRATQIRTLKQETVIVPNSTARVSINTSNFWSRAVIVMPVPLLGSSSPADAADRAEAATRRALEREEIAEDLIGELEVQPAVEVTPPATVGMPWTVDMRFMVQVEAGTQWQVERTVRMSILEEFWDEYGSATTVTGTLTDSVLRSAEAAAPPEQTVAAHRAAVDASAPADKTDDRPVAERPPRDADEDLPAEHSTVPAGYETPSGKDPAADQGGAGLTTEDSEAKTVKSEAVTDADDDGHPATVVMGSTAAGATKIAGPARDETVPDAEEEEKEEEDPSSLTGWRRTITWGGNMRLSTAFLLLGLLVLLVLRLLTASAETADGERVSGPLAPRPISIGDTSAEEDLEPAEEPQQQQQQPVTPTEQDQIPATPAPTLGTPNPNAPGEQPTPTNSPNAPQQPQQDSPGIQQTQPQGSPAPQEQTATQQQTEPMSPSAGTNQNYFGGTGGGAGAGAESETGLQ